MDSEVLKNYTIMHYLNELNEAQRSAVETLKGPVMIIAGAGSGKTKVLTARIAHLIANGVDAYRIMALTFTNKAAQEIKHRVETAVNNTESRNVYAGTFHSIFARILRVEAEHLGYTQNFTIYDVDDSKQVLKSVLQDLSLDPKGYRLNTLYNRISNAKNELITPEEYEQDEMRKAHDAESKIPRFWEVYKFYCIRCFKNNAMDFDDILLNTYKLFSRFPEVLHKYQHKITHILIDEFQDTNPLQYAIIRRLAAVHENICVVGDDAQSIYSFRGASIQNILDFKKDYPDVQIFKLEQNYRSTKNILQTANTLIKINKFQIEKNLWTAKNAAGKVYVRAFERDYEEAREVVNTLLELNLRYQIPYKEIAILYRTNAQSRIFEEHLRKNAIPYVVYGGFSFYQRKEVKDLLAYLKVIVNPQDNESLKRIINYPTRGIGDTSINKYSVFAYENNSSIYAILQNIAHFENRTKVVQSIQEFVNMIEYLKAEAATKNAHEIATLIANQVGMLQEFFEDKTPEGIARMQHIEELLNSIKDFIESENPNQEDRSLSSYLQQISLVTSGDEEKKEQQNQVVKLMTVHAAKGLEFECVFVCGVQEGIFPSIYAINTREDMEEERRLFYVAITRAKQHLYISYSTSHYIRGNIEYCRPSIFINELDPSSTEFQYNNAKPNIAASASHNGSTYIKKNVLQKAMLGNTFVHQPSKNFQPYNDFSNYVVGKKIEHEKFGFGTITSMNNDSLIATIAFEHVGEKKIMLRYAKTSLVS